MRILNCMFGRGLGGLEQAAYDYHEALALAGYEVTSVLHKRAAIKDMFTQKDMAIKTLAPAGEWDHLRAGKLRRFARHNEADVVIAHGNRAIGLALKALRGRIPVIGVAHNYKIKKRFHKCDGVFCITRDLIEEMVHLDQPRSKLFHIPNLIRSTEVTPRSAFHEPPVIGTLGRFVEKKGMDILLQAIAALRQQNIEVQGVIGGDGPLALALKAHAERLGIADCVSFPGWVDDKEAFFASLDMFVLPSHHEPFGIVLIEAMNAGLPCITTATEGPCEIITQQRDAIMVDKAQPYQMAQSIRELLDEPERAFAMGAAAQQTVKQRYDITVVSEKLRSALTQMLRLADKTDGPI